MSSTGLLVFLAVSIPLAAERFNLEQWNRIVNLYNPQITPDGERIVVAIARVNLKDNRMDDELVQVDVASGRQKVLTRRAGVRQHKFSPDGTKLAFLAPADGKPQIWVLPMDGGEAVQITKSPTGVQQYDWRPDGKAFAYSAADEAPKVEGDEKANKSFEADVNYLLTEAPRPAHLWTVSADGGDAKRLTSGAWSVVGPLSWSPDGAKVAFQAQPKPGVRYWLEAASRTLDVNSGAVSPLSGKNSMERLVGYSPDGRHFAYAIPRDGKPNGVQQLFVAPVAGGPPRIISQSIDSDVHAMWAPDGKSLYAQADLGANSTVWNLPLDGPPRRMDLGSLGRIQPAFAKGGRIALVSGEPDRPPELYIMETGAAPPRRLTDFNAQIAALELGRQEPLVWRGPDNFEMSGIVTYPPEYKPGKPYPLVLQIHGGPQSASLMGFAPRPQWLASHGWIVFEPNYRGSTNHGHAFQTAIHNDAGAGPGRDVMSGVDLLIKKGIADPNKMAVSGWSYGGYMTSWLLGNYPDRWKAGVAGAPVTDHIDQYAFSDIHSIVATYYGGSPFTDPKRLQAYRDQAPITYAHRIKAPTLILCDTGDQRVPITESYMLYHAIRDNGVKTKFIAYPVAGHAPSDPIHQRDVNRRWAEWIKEHFEEPKQP